MTWHALVDPAFSGRLCLTLLHSVWQVALLVFIAWCVDRFWRHRSVERRYALNVAALAATFAAMPITYMLLDVAEKPAEVAVEAPLLVTAVEPRPASTEASPVEAQFPTVAEAPTIAPQPETDRPALVPAAIASPSVEPSPRWLLLAPWLVALYTAGVVLMLARLAVGIVRAYRLGADAELLADGPVVEALRSLASKWSMRVVPALARAERIAVPKVVGLARPMILLPASAISGLSLEELEMILAHELAHVRRYDTWVNLGQRLAEAVLFFNPALWYLSRRISTLREYCCDEMTCGSQSASTSEPRVRYATALLRVVELAKPNAATTSDLASLAAGRSPSEIRRRVARLFGEPLREPLRISRGGVLTLVLLGVSLAVGLPVWNTQAESNTVAEAKDDDKPFEEDKEATAQKETVVGERPRGNCSISGIVVSAATGKPVEHARMYLHYNTSHGSIFIRTARDGTFIFKDIPTGPFSLQSSHTAGYQDVAYHPEGKSGQFPPFSLKDGEHRSGIVLKVKRAHQISGRILDENGKILKNVDALRVLAWVEKDDGKGYTSKQTVADRADGSYLIDGLGDKPVYVMAINWRAAKEGNAYPPIYYPSNFSRSDAKPITFDEEPSIDNIDITLQKEGGLVIEGTVTDETGKPVPEAFVVAHRHDMLFDFVTAYTDERGSYRIQGLGDGEFLVHVDAVHRGLVRMRAPIELDSARQRTQQSFTLTEGVTISGKFVDQEGKDWQIGESYGHANNAKDQVVSNSSFSLTSFWNKHRPKNVVRSSGGSFSLGEGSYVDGQMIFPTKSTFVIQGMMPGHTMIDFSPKKEDQKVVEILYDGRNIMTSGIKTKPSQEIKDVIIVIGTQ